MYSIESRHDGKCGITYVRWMLNYMVYHIDSHMRFHYDKSSEETIHSIYDSIYNVLNSEESKELCFLMRYSEFISDKIVINITRTHNDDVKVSYIDLDKLVIDVEVCNKRFNEISEIVCHVVLALYNDCALDIEELNFLIIHLDKFFVKLDSFKNENISELTLSELTLSEYLSNHFHDHFLCQYFYTEGLTTNTQTIHSKWIKAAVAFANVINVFSHIKDTTVDLQYNGKYQIAIRFLEDKSPAVSIDDHRIEFFNVNNQYVNEFPEDFVLGEDALEFAHYLMMVEKSGNSLNPGQLRFIVSEFLDMYYSTQEFKDHYKIYEDMTPRIIPLPYYGEVGLSTVENVFSDIVIKTTDKEYRLTQEDLVNKYELNKLIGLDEPPALKYNWDFLFHKRTKTRRTLQ